MAVLLPKSRVDEIFCNANSQGDAFVALYNYAQPDWLEHDKDEQMIDWPQAGRELNDYIHLKFIEFDEEHHPDIIAGGLWMNRGFLTNPCLGDWEVKPTHFGPRDLDI